jgi:hypothetical protein
MRATCPINMNFLDFITQTIFGEVYRLWSSSLCSLLQPPATSSLLGPDILLSTLNMKSSVLRFERRDTNFLLQNKRIYKPKILLTTYYNHIYNFAWKNDAFWFVALEQV